MKNLIVATFVIIALGSTIKCEAKALFLFPGRFDYKQDKTNDGVVKTLVYSSPFSGRTYNLDYLSRFNFNSDAPATTSKPAPHPHHFKHMLNWDINWNFNHGSKTANKADDSKPTEATTVATERPVEASTKASSSSSSYNGQIGHKKIDVKWSLDFNHGGSASTSSSSTEKPRTVDESDAKPTDEDNDIDPTSNLDE